MTTVTATSAKEPFAHLVTASLKRHHQMQVYKACNNVQLGVKLILRTAVRLGHPGILLYPAYAVLNCHPDAAYPFVVDLLFFCQPLGLLFLPAPLWLFVRQDYVGSQKIFLYSAISQVHVHCKHLIFWSVRITHLFIPPAKRKRILPEQGYVVGFSNDGAADSQNDVVFGRRYGSVVRVRLFLARVCTVFPLSIARTAYGYVGAIHQDGSSIFSRYELFQLICCLAF